MKKLLKKKEKKGFTLIEVILIMFFVSVAFVGVNTAYVQVAKNSNEKEKEIMASNLGQEFIEIARAIRDANYECAKAGDAACKERPWYNGIDKGSHSQEYAADYTSADNNGNNPPSLSTANDSNKGLCKASGRYKMCNKNGAEFTRVATVKGINTDKNPANTEDPDKPGSLEIKVTVSWTAANGVDRKVEVSDTLYHWQNIVPDQASVVSYTAPKVTLQSGEIKTYSINNDSNKIYNVCRKSGASDIVTSKNDQIDKEKDRTKFKWTFDDADEGAQANWAIYDGNDIKVADSSDVSNVSNDDKIATNVYLPVCKKGTSSMKNQAGCSPDGKMGFGKDVAWNLRLYDDSGNVQKIGGLTFKTTTETKSSEISIAGPADQRCINQNSTQTFSWSSTVANKLFSYYKIDFTSGPMSDQSEGDPNNPQKNPVFSSGSKGISFSTPGTYKWKLEVHDICYGDNWDGKDNEKTMAISGERTLEVNRPIQIPYANLNNKNSGSATVCGASKYTSCSQIDSPCPAGPSCGPSYPGGVNPSQIADSRTCNNSPCPGFSDCKTTTIPRTSYTCKVGKKSVNCGCGNGQCGTSCTPHSCTPLVRYQCKKTQYSSYGYNCSMCRSCSQTVGFQITDDWRCSQNKSWSISTPSADPQSGFVTCSKPQESCSEMVSRTFNWTASTPGYNSNPVCSFGATITASESDGMSSATKSVY